MKYALLSSIGGEPIEASQADYQHYKGFLKCSICGKTVFLRKAHNKGKTKVSAAFIHHKAIPEVSICELRTGKYTKEDVERLSNTARGQRLAKLRISLWKFLKSTLSVDLTHWTVFKKSVDTHKGNTLLIEYAKGVMEESQDFILGETFDKAQFLFFTNDSKIGIKNGKEYLFKEFVDKNKSNWELHCKISKEMLEAFLKNPEFEEIRHRLLCCLCHPNLMLMMPGLVEEMKSGEDWQLTFTAYLTLEIVFIFLTIDWIEIFSE